MWSYSGGAPTALMVRLPNRNSFDDQFLSTADRAGKGGLTTPLDGGGFGK